jgi:hypothetical protein
LQGIFWPRDWSKPMKFTIFAAAAGALLASGTAFAQARDKGSEGSSSDPDRGPGGTRLAFDLDYANGMTGNVGSGLGGAVRFGREYDLVLLSLTPEFMGSLDKFGDPGNELTFAGLAGGRATLGKVIEPGVFAHVGAGHATLPGDNLTGLAMDLGLTLDLTLVPAVDLGIHAAYDSVTWGDSGTFDYYRLGAHLALAP